MLKTKSILQSILKEFPKVYRLLKMSTELSTENHAQSAGSVDKGDKGDIIQSSQETQHSNFDTNSKRVKLLEINKSTKIEQECPASNIGFNFNPTVSVDQFFNDDQDRPNQTTHNLEESPCYPIIHSKSVGNHIWYYCRLHPDFKNISLSSIEHHCRYHEPDQHKAEILKLLSGNQEIHLKIESPNKMIQIQFY